jgi:hypothetical protein
MCFPSLYVLPFPLCASSLCFVLRVIGDFVREKREGGRESKNKQTYLLCFLKEEDRERQSENKQTYLLCFLKKKEEGGREQKKKEEEEGA